MPEFVSKTSNRSSPRLSKIKGDVLNCASDRLRDERVFVIKVVHIIVDVLRAVQDTFRKMMLTLCALTSRVRIFYISCVVSCKMIKMFCVLKWYAFTVIYVSSMHLGLNVASVNNSYFRSRDNKILKVRKSTNSLSWRSNLWARYTSTDCPTNGYATQMPTFSRHRTYVSMLLLWMYRSDCSPYKLY